MPVNSDIRDGSMNDVGNDQNGRRRSSARELSEIVTNAACRKKTRRLSANLTKLNLATNKQLHGRENEIKLLKSKLLREFTVRPADDMEEALSHELLLIAGVSG